jgi:hypothetical protein
MAKRSTSPRPAPTPTPRFRRTAPAPAALPVTPPMAAPAAPALSPQALELLRRALLMQQAGRIAQPMPRPAPQSGLLGPLPPGVGPLGYGGR